MADQQESQQPTYMGGTFVPISGISKYVGKPIEAYKEAGAVLTDRYDKAKAKYYEIEDTIKNFQVFDHSVDDQHINEANAYVDSKFKDVIDNDQFHKAAGTVMEVTTGLKSNKALKSISAQVTREAERQKQFEERLKTEPNIRQAEKLVSMSVLNEWREKGGALDKSGNTNIATGWEPTTDMDYEKMMKLADDAAKNIEKLVSLNTNVTSSNVGALGAGLSDFEKNVLTQYTENTYKTESKSKERIEAAVRSTLEKDPKFIAMSRDYAQTNFFNATGRIKATYDDLKTLMPNQDAVLQTFALATNDAYKSKQSLLDSKIGTQIAWLNEQVNVGKMNPKTANAKAETLNKNYAKETQLLKTEFIDSKKDDLLKQLGAHPEIADSFYKEATAREFREGVLTSQNYRAYTNVVDIQKRDVTNHDLLKRLLDKKDKADEHTVVVGAVGSTIGDPPTNGVTLEFQNKITETQHLLDIAKTPAEKAKYKDQLETLKYEQQSSLSDFSAALDSFSDNKDISSKLLDSWAGSMNLFSNYGKYLKGESPADYEKSYQSNKANWTGGVDTDDATQQAFSLMGKSQGNTRETLRLMISNPDAGAVYDKVTNHGRLTRADHSGLLGVNNQQARDAETRAQFIDKYNTIRKELTNNLTKTENWKVTQNRQGLYLGDKPSNITMGHNRAIMGAIKTGTVFNVRDNKPLSLSDADKIFAKGMDSNDYSDINITPILGTKSSTDAMYNVTYNEVVTDEEGKPILLEGTKRPQMLSKTMTIKVPNGAANQEVYFKQLMNTDIKNGLTNTSRASSLKAGVSIVTALGSQLTDVNGKSLGASVNRARNLKDNDSMVIPLANGITIEVTKVPVPANVNAGDSQVTMTYNNNGKRTSLLPPNVVVSAANIPGIIQSNYKNNGIDPEVLNNVNAVLTNGYNLKK